MKKIKLIAPILCAVTLPCVVAPSVGCLCKASDSNFINKSETNTIVQNIETKNSSKDVVFTLPESTEEGKDLEIKYSITDDLKVLDVLMSEIYVGNTSIKNKKGVEYRNGIVKIPTSLLNNDVTIKLITCHKGYRSANRLLDNSWNEVIEACNKFENSDHTEEAKLAFLHSFRIDGQPLTYTNALIGATIRLNINNQKHIARIIDVERDTIENSDKRAALTFELATLLSNSNGEAMGLGWNKQKDKNYDYTNSMLRKGLTGLGNGELKWFKPESLDEVNETRTAWDMLPTEVTSGIKNVDKWITRRSYDGHTTNVYVQKYTDKLFPLTVTEMNQKDDGALIEGSPYTYWINHDLDAFRVKWSVNGKERPYWLATPYFTKLSWATYRIDHDGSLISLSVIYLPLAVSFGFCI